MIRSRSPIKRSPVKRSGKPIKANPDRKRREFARAYGGQLRVAFVKSLPCCACGVEGYSENAHIRGDGAGRKADARFVVPLCGPHPNDLGYDIGCHAWLHEMGRDRFEKYWPLNLDELAAETERAWHEAHPVSAWTNE